MTGRRTLLVVASILLAAIGTALIWLYVQGAETRARDEVQSSARLVPVTVTTGGATAGTLGGALAVKTTNAPAELAADAVTQAEVAQQKLKADVSPGQILRRSMFTSDAVSGVSAGKQAVSITIGDPQRMPALLKPGLDVAIYAYGGSRPPELVVEHATVLTVGPGPGGTQVAPTTIGFLESPEDARKILAITTDGRTAALLINGTSVTPRP